jgi:transketolase
MPTRRDLANAIRALSMDAVQKANSGHPGAPMGMADIAEVLWRDVLKFNPGNPAWWDRDRFVLSNGHASMLLYSVLHLTGYPLSMEEIKNFRQFGSKTAGHPERELHLGIETTTGPLGQGFANAVGMALAERSMAATFNRPGHDIIDHHTYVFLGDGCMMEGISHEVASFAGVQKLGKLILVYDDNGISIDGKVVGWFGDDTAERFEAYGWHVLRHVDGQSSDAIAAALAAARAETARPSLICAKTVIGWGAPNKQGTASMHGEAMGNEEIAATRLKLGWTSPPFEIPADIRAAWDRREKGARAEQEWNTRFAAYKLQFPELAAELARRMEGELPHSGRGQGARDAPILAGGFERARPLHAGITRRFGGSDALERHLAQGLGVADPGFAGRQLSALRRARVRHVGHAERRGLPWGVHPVRRHLPDLFRLRAQCRAHGLPHAIACDLRVHPRLHRAR